MKFEITSDRGDEKNVVSTVCFQWVRNVLEMTGIDWEDCFEGETAEDLSVLQRGKIRKKLKQNNLFVLDDSDGGVKIYIDTEVIGEWHKPNFILNYDHAEIDPKKKTFILIEASCWSVFDDEENQEETEDSEEYDDSEDYDEEEYYD